MTREDLAIRYGRTRANSRRTRVIALITAAVFAVVLVGWVVWAGLDNSGAELEAKDTGHTVIDEHSVSIDFLLTVPKGSTSSCALQAQSAKFAIVGWKVIDIPASDKATRGITETIRTTEQSVTGLIYRCWLT
ncbi:MULTISPECIES: DUF4307 domain-containing protein [unclassified Agreia]|uniref:DUF4307 domain-containing protein n=1 Tax=unclassified Agreia TaxID=2641148 RepID=UPI00070195EC|nr:MULTISPECIES: DUF4307 domain-containing protein [Microbacteriaceae]KQM58057.1 hypothetical protein ASE64_10875 [Agreia sp. Leaf210]KQR22419.1 hypothetical protein ASF79_09265 [Agreia sp. Leaf335]